MKQVKRGRSFERHLTVLVLTAAAVAACSAGQGPGEGEGRIGVSQSALAVSTVFSTGVGPTGAPLASGAVDPHYTMTSTDPNFPGPNAVAVDAQGALAPGVQPWTPNTATAKWISLRTSAESPVAQVPYAYTFTTTFAVSGDPTTATLTGTVACDDSCVMLLNGTQVQQFAVPGWGTARAFTLAAGSPFKAGQNTLAVRTTNSGGIVTGFQLSVPATPPAACTQDSQCASTQFCNTQTSTCVPKIPDGGPVPTIPGHTPPLVGSCSAAVSTAVCVSATCNSTTNTCGPGGVPVACTQDSQCASTQFCNTQTSTCVPKIPDGLPVPTIPGHAPPLVGTCSAAVGTAVCVSGTCNSGNTCGQGGVPVTCTQDSQCASTQFCNTQSSTCTPKIPDGTPVPTIPGHTPPLIGTCSVAVGSAVCLSGACDPSTNGCGAPGGPTCKADADCASTQFCNTQTSACTPKLPDGTPIPTVPGHTPPLVGTCSAAVGTAVCVSGACNVANNQCTSGCKVDSDCASTQFCNTESLVCVPKLPNGDPVPTITGHTPPLTGTCDAPSGLATCFAGVCDTKDNDCGYANGDGPCTGANGGTVCRSGVCDTAAGTCAPGGACTKDSDCATTQFCNTQTSVCVAKIPSGLPVPTITGHTPPLTGACTAAVGAAVCVAAVCDPTNNACGYTNGNGPCSADNGPLICQSGTCNPGGTCGPGASCGTDSDCVDPAAPVCDPATNVCVPGSGAGDGGGASNGDGGANGGSDGGKGTSDGGAGAGGYAEGGGLSCSAGPLGAGTAGGSGLALVGAALVVGAVRRKRVANR